MKTIKLLIELKYNAMLMHGGDGDKEAKEWFFKDILGGDKLVLFSGEIDDGVGDVKVLEINAKSAKGKN